MNFSHLASEDGDGREDERRDRRSERNCELISADQVKAYDGMDVLEVK